MSNQDLGKIAAALGHGSLRVDQRGPLFRGYCSCGYETTNRRTLADAAGGLRHHLALVIRDAQANGASFRAVGSSL